MGECIQNQADKIFRKQRLYDIKQARRFGTLLTARSLLDFVSGTFCHLGSFFKA